MNANAFQCANIENVGKESTAIREYTASCRSWAFPDPGQTPDFYTWLTLGLVAGTLLQLQQQQKLFTRLPKGLWGRLLRCTKNNNFFFLWPLKLAFIWALLYETTKMMDLSIWLKCLLTKNMHLVCFLPKEVGTEAETEVSFIAPAPRSYSCARQLLILKMLYFVLCLRYAPKSSPSLGWPPGAALCLQKSCLYLRYFSPLCVWSVFWRQFLGLGFWILQGKFSCIFHSGGMKPCCHAERFQLQQAWKHRSF